MGGVVVANKPREGEVAEARDKGGACGERESTAVEDAVNVGDAAGGDGRWQPKVGGMGGKGM